LLTDNYGYLNATFLASYVAPMTITGDTLLTTYEFESNTIYIAWSQNNVEAWLRPLLQLNMTQIFNFVNL